MIESTKDKEGIEVCKDETEDFARWMMENGCEVWRKDNSSFSFFFMAPDFCRDKDRQREWSTYHERLSAMRKVLGLTGEKYNLVIAEIKTRVEIRDYLSEKIKELSLSTLQAMKQAMDKLIKAEEETKRQ